MVKNSPALTGDPDVDETNVKKYLKKSWIDYFIVIKYEAVEVYHKPFPKVYFRKD